MDDVAVAVAESLRVAFIGTCRACKKPSQCSAEIAERRPALRHRVTERLIAPSKRSWRIVTGPRTGTVTPLESPWKGNWQIALPCHKCGATMTFAAVAGTVTEKPCGSRCMGSKGPTCECACGGRNHGSSHC